VALSWYFGVYGALKQRRSGLRPGAGSASLKPSCTSQKASWPGWRSAGGMVVGGGRG
jgi:hypothetical protein